MINQIRLKGPHRYWDACEVLNDDLVTNRTCVIFSTIDISDVNGHGMDVMDIPWKTRNSVVI